MSILNFFKSSKPTIEKVLEDFYYQKYQPFGKNRKNIRTLISQAARKIKEDGKDKLPHNYGNFILEQANNSNETYKIIVDKAINGGANYDDILLWWNLHEIERRMIAWEDNNFRLMSFISLKDEKRMSDDEALKKLRHSFPLYGDPTDESNMNGDDRPLPNELHDRINKIAMGFQKDSVQESLSKYSSMNAYLRAQLKDEEII